MFDDLSKHLSSAFGRFRARGLLTEANIEEGLRDVRTALLEADVSLSVVQTLMQSINDKSVGAELIKSVRPEQQVVKIVHDELLEIMGKPDSEIRFEKSGPTIIMMSGLQGSGKTTTVGKLAKMLVERYNRRPLLVAADLQRPAAIEQLKVLGQQVGVPVHAETGVDDPVKVCQNSLVAANKLDRDTIIVDTAGRLHIDDDLMVQLHQIEKRIRPHIVFFVCDAMTGQDAVNSAAAFNKALDLDGVILTKLDGDARGGAALSIRHVTGVPIKFVGKGEKLDKLEAFDPARVVSQMLGMGDIVSLVEEAQKHISEEEAARQQDRMSKGKFDLNDFRNQIIQMKKMGPVKDLLGKIPGMGQMAGQLDGVDADSEVRRIQGIIDSMTPKERSNPSVIDISRRRRIAAGAGVDPADISSLIKQFEGMAALIKQMAQMSLMDRVRALTGMGRGGGMLNPAALMGGGSKGSTGKRLSPKEKEKLRKEREKAERKRRRDSKENRDGASPS